MATVRNWFIMEYGILMIFIGAFTPIPYKVIAVTTGVVAAESLANTGCTGMLTIINFVFVSLVGRGLRFFLEGFFFFFFFFFFLLYWLGLCDSNCGLYWL